MTAISNLTAAHFALRQIQKKKPDGSIGSVSVMTTSVPGTVLIMFKMPNCPGCQALEPIFLQLANKQRNIGYAVADVSKYRDITIMSQKAGDQTQITAVPKLIIYSGGLPSAVYTGTKNLPSLESFIAKYLQHQSSKPQAGQANSQTFVRAPQGPQPKNGNNKTYMPEFGNTNMPKTSQYMRLGGVDEEDESRLLIPDQVTPHNAPWQNLYKTLGVE
jgi:thiol-disulfide isomerase/thioredoxin